MKTHTNHKFLVHYLFTIQKLQKKYDKKNLENLSLPLSLFFFFSAAAAHKNKIFEIFFLARETEKKNGDPFESDGVVSDRDLRFVNFLKYKCEFVEPSISISSWTSMESAKTIMEYERMKFEFHPGTIPTLYALTHITFNTTGTFDKTVAGTRRP